MNPNPPANPNRREFLKKTTLGAGLLAFPTVLRSADSKPNSRLNIAIIGVAGKGRSAIVGLAEENLVAFCDVDMRGVAEARAEMEDLDGIITRAEAKGARWFRDYRVMLTEMDKEIDAVVISIPDHMHYPVALSALNMGKHVYCEKPLTHTVEEARLLTAAAARAGVVTQMGNQGHSNAGARLVKEWIDAGVIGPVREVHSWTDRPLWPQGMEKPDHSKMIPVLPEELSWDLWLGVAEPRPYDPAYLPFSWRGWWDFGSGAFGDMACHIMDSPYWALQLDNPDWIEAACTPVTGWAAPKASVVTYQYPARGKFPPLTYKWYDGGMLPPMPSGIREWPEMVSRNGTFIIGEEAVMVVDTYGQTVRILPDGKFDALKPSLPPRTLRRIKGSHLQEWTNAIREGRKAVSDFSYAGPFTEMVQLGNVALRAGQRIQYDGRNMRITNLPGANRYLKKEYRPGWIL